MKSYLAKSSLTIRNPNFVRPWQHVLEPLFGYLELAEKLFYSKDYMGGWNFGPSISDQMSVIDIVNKFSSKIELNYQNVSNHTKISEANFLMLNSEKAKTYLNWFNILTIDQSINFIIEWFENWHKKINVEKITYSQIEYYLNEIMQK